MAGVIRVWYNQTLWPAVDVVVKLEEPIISMFARPFDYSEGLLRQGLVVVPAIENDYVVLKRVLPPLRHSSEEELVVKLQLGQPGLANPVSAPLVLVAANDCD